MIRDITIKNTLSREDMDQLMVLRANLKMLIEKQENMFQNVEHKCHSQGHELCYDTCPKCLLIYNKNKLWDMVRAIDSVIGK